MNALKYIASRKYRNKYNEEYSREFIDKYEAHEYGYEKIYDELRNKENK